MIDHNTSKNQAVRRYSPTPSRQYDGGRTQMVADQNGDFIRIEDLSEQIAIEGSRLGPANAKSIEAALEYQRQYGGTIMRRYVSEWERVVYDGAA